MSKEIKLILIKNEAGITVVNEAALTVDFFDESDQNRQAFIKYMVEEFINYEIFGGKKYR